jgi:hypothetical protein
MRSTRLVPLLLVLMMASSCGGEGSVFEGSATTTTEHLRDLVDAEALTLGEAIVGDLGPEAAPLAVAYALDRGYTAAQIADGARAGALQADGTISGFAPELPLWGIFSDLPANGSATGGGSRTATALARRSGEPNPYRVQITKDQWLTGLAAEADRVFSGLPTPSAPSSVGSTTTTTEPPAPDETERATIMIGLIIDLSNLGYSAEQIILGIALGEVRIAAVPSGQGPVGCWLLQDSAGGGVIAPALPVLAEALPGTAPCRQAIDRLAPPDTGSTTTTTTTAAAVDADGIRDGTYTGIVEVTGEVTAPVYEVLAGEIHLEVTDQSVQAEVEYTLRVSVRSSFEEAVCVATIDYLYVGEQAALPTLGFPLQPVSQSIRLLEGPECGIVDPWETTAEDYLLAGFAEERTITLGGSFADGRFEGYISGTPLGVTAALGE